MKIQLEYKILNISIQGDSEVMPEDAMEHYTGTVQSLPSCY